VKPVPAEDKPKLAPGRVKPVPAEDKPKPAPIESKPKPAPVEAEPVDDRPTPVEETPKPEPAESLPEAVSASSMTRPMSPPRAPDAESQEPAEDRPQPTSVLPKLGAVLGAGVAICLLLGIVAAIAIVWMMRDAGTSTRPASAAGGGGVAGEQGEFCWIDAQGEQFVAGYTPDCPPGAICLVGTGLEGERAVQQLDGHAVGAAGARRLDTFVRCTAFLRQAGAYLAPWEPADADVTSGECLRLFPGDRPWTAGLAGEPEPLDLDDWARGSTPYRMSSFARDLVRAVSDGHRAWILLQEGIDPAAEDPSAGLYRNRLAAGIELGLVSGSLDDMDALPRALDAALAHSDSILVRLPSDPLVAFDGHGPFTMGSGFRRELVALGEVAERRPSLDFELCVVALQQPTKAHPDAAAWDGARLDYLVPDPKC